MNHLRSMTLALAFVKISLQSRSGTAPLMPSVLQIAFKRCCQTRVRIGLPHLPPAVAGVGYPLAFLASLGRIRVPRATRRASPMMAMSSLWTSISMSMDMRRKKASIAFPHQGQVIRKCYHLLVQHLRVPTTKRSLRVRPRQRQPSTAST